MKKSTTADLILYYSPRVLAIIFALFLGMFSLDILAMKGDFWKKMAGLLIHLIPSFIIIISLIIAWKKEFMGAMLFFSLALGYILMAWNRQNFTAILLIAGPMILIGTLFLINDKKAKKEDVPGETGNNPGNSEE